MARVRWRHGDRQRVPRLGWHVLRHTFASQLVMRGVPLKAVQELLGHASMEMTMRYSHLSPDVRRDAVRVLDGQTSQGTQLGTIRSRKQLKTRANWVEAPGIEPTRSERSRAALIRENSHSADRDRVPSPHPGSPFPSVSVGVGAQFGAQVRCGHDAPSAAPVGLDSVNTVRRAANREQAVRRTQRSRADDGFLS
jgi:hypothetical protein